jgi:hypothetical protein
LKLGHTLSTHTSSLLILILITQTKKKTKNYICTEKETFILQREFRGRKNSASIEQEEGEKCQWHLQSHTSKSQTLHRHLAPSHLPLHQPPQHLLSVGFLQ